VRKFILILTVLVILCVVNTAEAAYRCVIVPKVVSTATRSLIKVGEDVVGFFWKNKVAIATGTVLVTAAMQPQPFIDGAIAVAAGPPVVIQHSGGYGVVPRQGGYIFPVVLIGIVTLVVLYMYGGQARIVAKLIALATGDELTRGLVPPGGRTPDDVMAHLNKYWLPPVQSPSAAPATTQIKAMEGHVYQVSIPVSMRRPSDDYDILVEVTLSYSASPRRTRRHAKKYLSNWVSWTSSNLGEDVNSFLDRALKEQENPTGNKGDVFQWTFHENPKWGKVKDVKRNPGTIQKDWAVVKSHSLPKEFCIAVVGHKGWSHDPDTTANYTLVVSFEILGKEIPIYEPLQIENQVEIEMDEGELEF